MSINPEIYYYNLHRVPICKLDLLTAIQFALQPIVTGMLGLPRETTEAFLMGFMRRDYGAAGLYKLAEKGLLTPVQIFVRSMHCQFLCYD